MAYSLSNDISRQKQTLVISDDVYYLHAFLHQKEITTLLINDSEGDVLENINAVLTKLDMNEISVLLIKHPCCHLIHHMLKLITFKKKKLMVLIDLNVKMQRKIFFVKNVSLVSKHMPFFELLALLRKNNLKTDVDDNSRQLFAMCRTWVLESTKLKAGGFEYRYTRRYIQKRMSSLKINIAEVVGVSEFNILVFYKFLILLKAIA